MCSSEFRYRGSPKNGANLQKIQTGQFGVTNDASLEENMRRKRASQQTGDYMNAL